MSGASFSGVVLALRADRTLERSSGLADRAAGRSWTVDTRSQVASISKQLVAACTLLLVDRGTIDLDQPVTRHLPLSDRHWDEVSVRHLLTHTSGMNHWGDQPGFDVSAPMRGDQRLPLLLAAPRFGRSGDAFRYSSPGYIVLSAVLAAASGTSYQELAHELVVEPLGLADTHLGSPGPGPVALGYRRGEPVEPWDLGEMAGTGDAWSTVGDLARLVSAWHTGALAPSRTLSLVPHVPVPSRNEREQRIRVHGYRAGHFVGTVDGQPACVQPGDNPGYRSLALWLPESSTTVVALGNEETDDIEQVAAQAARDAID